MLTLRGVLQVAECEVIGALQAGSLIQFPACWNLIGNTIIYKIYELIRSWLLALPVLLASIMQEAMGQTYHTHI